MPKTATPPAAKAAAPKRRTRKSPAGKTRAALAPSPASPEATKPAKATKATKAAKVAKPAKPAKATKPPKAPKPAKVPKAKGPEAQAAKVAPRKVKTVRDSFNMPAEDYALIADLKKRALATAREVKKSELLRAGIRMLAALKDEAFKAALAAVPSVKTGRPGKKRKA